MSWFLYWLYGCSRGIVVGIFVGLILLASFARHITPPPVPAPSSGITELREYWGAQIERKGAQQAYAAFTSAYAPNPPETHLAAHVMGDLLFKEMGLRGLSICDSSFDMGCYHQFFADAVVAKGPPVMSQLAALCQSFPGEEGRSCFHGLGHGIFEYIGRSNLLESLAYCDSLNSSYSYGPINCVQGVFMEYNDALFFNGTSTRFEVRPLNTNDPYAPCDEPQIQAHFKSECYESLVSWWLENGLTVSHTGMLCAKVPSPYDEACYLGFGPQLPGVLFYDEPRIIVACEEMPSALAIRWCLEGSANTLSSLKHDASLIEGTLESACVKS